MEKILIEVLVIFTERLKVEELFVILFLKQLELKDKSINL